MNLDFQIKECNPGVEEIDKTIDMNNKYVINM